jgi:hypothetical protein
VQACQVDEHLRAPANYARREACRVERIALTHDLPGVAKLNRRRDLMQRHDHEACHSQIPLSGRRAPEISGPPEDVLLRTTADGQSAARYNFLYTLKAGPAARPRHDGHGGTGLTLLTGAQRDTVVLP